MKKEYEKPFIVFESFTLSTNIAANCDRHVSTMTQGVCSIKGSAPGMNLFSNGINSCFLKWDEFVSGPFDGYCYHVPTLDRQLFHS